MAGRIGTSRLLSGARHRRVKGERVPGVASERSGGKHTGRRHHRPAVARWARRGGSSTATTTATATCRCPSFVENRFSVPVWGSPPRRLGGKPGGDSADRQIDRRGVAGSEDHLAGRLRFLPERAD